MARKFALVVFILVFTSACGFHLRGESTSLPNDISVSSRVHGAPILFELRKSLKRQGRFASRGEAAVHLDIHKTQWHSQLLSIDQGNRSRVVRFRVEYTLAENNQKVDRPVRNVEIERSLFTADQALLESDARIQDLKRRMMQEAVSQMLGDIQLFSMNK